MSAPTSNALGFYIEPMPKGFRRKCRCGCEQWASLIGRQPDGCGLAYGCQMRMRRWLRDEAGVGTTWEALARNGRDL